MELKITVKCVVEFLHFTLLVKWNFYLYIKNKSVEKICSNIKASKISAAEKAIYCLTEWMGTEPMTLVLTAQDHVYLNK